MRTGTVIEFDADVGLGRVADDSGATYEFHIVEIADASRTIEVGQLVSFDVALKFGREEAFGVRKLSVGV